MAFSLSSFWHTLGVPSTKIPIDIPAFVSYVIPPVVCYIVAAILAVTPQTRTVRAAIWPIVMLLAFRAAVSVDMSFGDPKMKFLNTELVLAMTCMAFHSLPWALTKKPPVRYIRSANSSPSLIMDALDLATNLRGIGWHWSYGLYIPRETRPTNRIAFALYAFVSAMVHGLMGGALYVAIRTFTTGDMSSPQGSTIFDDTLPLSVQYLRSGIITFLAGLANYFTIQTTNDLLSLPGVLLFKQDPAQWPPIFDRPWCATSLNDFWGRRWHQWFRQMFLLAGYPFSLVLGRAGTLIGAFIWSGVHHHLLLLLLNDRAEMWRMVVGFGMMAPGALIERAFYRTTGRRVGGMVGRVWTMTWLLVWGSVIADGFSKAGTFAAPNPVDDMAPLWVREWVEKVVIDFDAWLHSI